MADRNDQDLLHYDALMQEAQRGVVKAALRVAAQPAGMPGAHHFYITFKTRAPGVSAPPELTDKYEDEMTIVLQHQYWDLAPGETFFSVTLKFGGQPKKLSVPYAAVTRFYDPSVQFLLQFEPPEGMAEQPAAEPVRLHPERKGDSPVALVTAAKGEESDEAGEAKPEDKAGAKSEDGPKIVSLDQFRKK